MLVRKTPRKGGKIVRIDTGPAFAGREGRYFGFLNEHPHQAPNSGIDSVPVHRRSLIPTPVG
jgi:hypothetical protein